MISLSHSLSHSLSGAVPGAPSCAPSCALALCSAGLCLGTGEAVFNVTTINGSVPPTQFAVPSPADSERFFKEICSSGQAQGMGGTLEIDFLRMQFMQVLDFREQLGAFPSGAAARPPFGGRAQPRGAKSVVCASVPSSRY